ncbi:MAG: cysteine desulfurase [Cyanobacteria bacterium SBLK]|nr:cysteine desulfurase [Cyanobacteria bacterium SBLK]
MTPIYLDYHATTPCDRRVADRILHTLTEEFGNANSIDHVYGDAAEKAVKKAKEAIANLIQSSPQEIIFTSGATESINLAIQGSLNPHKPAKIALSTVEHKAVLDTCKALEQQKRAQLIYIPVNAKGNLDLNQIETILKNGVSLLCIMAANNEIGNIYPIEAIAKLAREYYTPFLCDAAQAVGKIPIKFADWGITFLAISAHKLYASKGIGALVVKKRTPLNPILFGGGHQQGMRSGTLNVSGIVGLGEACYLRQLEMQEDESRIAQLRDQLEQLLQAKIPGLIVNGDRTSRLAGNLHIAIPNIPNSAIIARIRHQLAISTGSACSSGVETPSHVLQAMKLPSEVIEGALRIGLGKFTTHAEIERAGAILADTVAQIRQLM